jgi:Flp pilus assembly pilin Flp
MTRLAITTSDRGLFARLVFDETGQDLIEYGLLAATIGIAGVLIFPLIQAKLGPAFSRWGSSVQGICTPANPGGSGGSAC